MTDEQRAELLALAERVERLTGESLCHWAGEVREIYVALGAEKRKAGFDYSEGVQHYIWHLGDKCLGEFLPSILTSIDAAMTLVPSGWMAGAYNTGYAEAAPQLGERTTRAIHVTAPTPAQALTAAALRARAAS